MNTSEKIHFIKKQMYLQLLEVGRLVGMLSTKENGTPGEVAKQNKIFLHPEY